LKNDRFVFSTLTAVDIYSSCLNQRLNGLYIVRVPGYRFIETIRIDLTDDNNILMITFEAKEVPELAHRHLNTGALPEF
jgi:hypothetical protein